MTDSCTEYSYRENHSESRFRRAKPEDQRRDIAFLCTGILVLYKDDFLAAPLPHLMITEFDVADEQIRRQRA